MFLSDRSIVSVSMPGMLFAADPVLARFCFALVGMLRIINILLFINSNDKTINLSRLPANRKYEVTYWSSEATATKPSSSETTMVSGLTALLR